VDWDYWKGPCLIIKKKDTVSKGRERTGGRGNECRKGKKRAEWISIGRFRTVLKGKSREPEKRFLKVWGGKKIRLAGTSSLNRLLGGKAYNQGSGRPGGSFLRVFGGKVRDYVRLKEEKS